MDVNCLKMNSSKTEFILFGFKWQLQKCIANNINANGEEIKHRDWIQYLGTLLDSQLSMTQHITAKCRTIMGNLLKIKQVRHMLTTEVSQTIVFGLVLSHLDYANPILANLPHRTLHLT